MARYLLDTNYLLWSLSSPERMSNSSLTIIQDIDKHQIFFSQISLIEVSIKLKIGKLDLIASVNDIYHECINKANFIFLPINNQHIFSYQHIPLFDQHRDPFDRLLIATAIAEKMAIITADEKFNFYKDIVEVIR